MREQHPSSRQLRDFFRGELPGADGGRIVRHLLAGCARCGARAAEHWPPRQPAVERLDESFARALDRLRSVPDIREAERAAAPELLDELAAHPPARQLVLARNSRRFRSWVLTELALERAFAAGFDDPRAALGLAELGVALAGALADSSCPAPLAADIAARALATRGNARRLRGDLAGAAADLRRAAQRLAEGSGDPLEEAFVLLRLAYLRLDRREFAGALASFDRAIGLFRLVGESHWVGRTLIDKGLATGYAGTPDAAIRLIERGLALLDPARDPRMALAAKHNLALFRCETGDLDRAASLVGELLPLYAARRERISRLKLRWLEGKLAQAQGRLQQAEEAFVEVQREFLDRELGFDAALVILDLAGIYLEQRRADDLKSLAAQVLPIFRTLEIHREALVALALFKRAVDLQQVTLRWIAELASYLERARGNPELRFRPPGQPSLA